MRSFESDPWDDVDDVEPLTIPWSWLNPPS